MRAPAQIRPARRTAVFAWIHMYEYTHRMPHSMSQKYIITTTKERPTQLMLCMPARIRNTRGHAEPQPAGIWKYTIHDI